MASAGDAIGEAEATTTKNRRRIYDYLGASDDGDEASPPPPETPPRLRLPRFTCARLRFVRLGRKGGGRGRKEVAAGEKSEDASVDSSGSKQAAGSSSSSSVAAGQTGMGLSMLLLLARTCVELNKTTEVRAQMEKLLKEMRDEASRMKRADHVVATPRTSKLQSSSAASSSCTSDTNTNFLEIARGENENKPWEDEGCAGMDMLEAEFETEPERQPVECKCNAGQKTSECSMQSSDDEFIELDGGHFGGGAGYSGRDIIDDDRDDESCEQHEGVSAIELERRLHELQHQRDTERIEELESALRCAEQTLTEKEMEARLWQDTATLALGQPPPPERDGQ